MILDLLRGRDFRSFLLANAFERVAASGMTVLLGFQVYALTHKPLDLGWLGLAEAIPGVTLVLYGGHIADRISRRRIVLATSAMLTLLAAALAALSGLPRATLLGGIYVIAFLSGVVRAFENPAASGMEAQVVPLAQLMRGVALLATTGRLADVFGPILAGFAWAAIGARDTYAAIAVLFALTCVMLAFVSERPPPAHAKGDNDTWRRMWEGVRYVFRDQILVGSMALDLFAVFFGGATALLPAFATDILHVGPTGFGLLRAASGAGSMVAALVAARLVPERRAGLILHAVVGGFGISMVVFGFSRSLWLSLAALFVAGICDGLSMLIRRAILRLASPEPMRGRIAAVKSVFVGSSNEIGAFESGFLASLIGTTASVWAGGLVTLGIVGFAAWKLPKLLKLDFATLARAEMSAAALADPDEEAAIIAAAS